VKKYTKPRRVSASTPVVQPSGNQTIVERVKRILAGNNPFSSAEDWFLLKEIHLICLFRRAKSKSGKEKLSEFISQREDNYLNQKEGPKSLTSQDFLALNQWITNQDSADKQDSAHKWVNNLLKRAKERKRQARREARMVKE